ncbi:hypothetical protein ACTXT7_003612 [Hymenolepis weldensis]
MNALPIDPWLKHNRLRYRFVIDNLIERLRFSKSDFEPVSSEDLNAGITITNEMKGHAVDAVSIKAKQSNSEIAGFLKVARSSVCKVGKELLHESIGGVLASTSKRRQEDCQRSDSLTQNT